MQFLVLAYDDTDEGAPARRMRVREAHLALTDKNKQKNHAIFGAAILDGTGTMIGSVMVMEYPDRAALDAWLAREPYVIGKVWKKVEILPCKVGPTFQR